MATSCLPKQVIKQLILAETNRRIRRAEYFYGLRNALAMLGVVMIGSAFLNSAGMPRLWQIVLSPAWAIAWRLFRRWMTKSVKDESPQTAPDAIAERRNSR